MYGAWQQQQQQQQQPFASEHAPLLCNVLLLSHRRLLMLDLLNIDNASSTVHPLLAKDAVAGPG
jgi:hypothetical protein